MRTLSDLLREAVEKSREAVEKSNRGGAGRGQGRPPVKAGEETVTVSLRMTKTHREKLKRLGGADWVRQRIEKAKLKVE